MTRDWALFWVSIGLMALAGAVVANVAFGSPMELGALGQWASAAGTVAAVLIALRNTRVSLQDAADREVARQTAADEAYINALYMLARMLKLSSQHVEQKLSGVKLTPDGARTTASRLHLDGLTAALDRMPLHSSPNPIFVVCFGSLRTASSNLSSKLQKIAAGTEPQFFDAADEIKLINTTIGLIEPFVDRSMVEGI